MFKLLIEQVKLQAIVKELSDAWFSKEVLVFSMVALPLVVQYAYLQEVVVVTRKLQFNALLVKYLQLFRGDVILGEGCHLVVPHNSVES